MKCIIPEISWNNRDPVFSLDIQPKTDEHLRLATSGSDTHIVIWYLKIDETSTISIEVAADLNKHQKAVNVVRWSPSGEFLASGDDESNIILWKQRTDVDPPSLEQDSEEYKENWSIFKILRGHMDDVYDISWSSDSKQLISGSVDNTAIIWNIIKSTKHILQPNHKGFVQGVTWDPLNKYFATLSSDRVCRVFDANTRKIISRSSKGTLPFPESSPLFNQTVRYYHDDTLKSYFRRLTFSPDGNLLITPAGCVETEHCNKKIHLSYIYTRYSFKQPALVLPSPDQFTVAVRCCPLLFEYRKDGPEKPVIPLPYRMIIAIASQSTVIFYDTQQIQPFAVVTNIHYTRITDIAWSSDGLIVAVSSTDGFCSLISFKPGELGEIFQPEENLSNTPEKKIEHTSNVTNNCKKSSQSIQEIKSEENKTEEQSKQISNEMVELKKPVDSLEVRENFNEFKKPNELIQVYKLEKKILSNRLEKSTFNEGNKLDESTKSKSIKNFFRNTSENESVNKPDETNVDKRESANEKPPIVIDESANDGWSKSDNGFEKMQCDVANDDTQDIKLVLEDSQSEESSPYKLSIDKE